MEEPLAARKANRREEAAGDARKPDRRAGARAGASEPPADGDDLGAAELGRRVADNLRR
jgi:hypothetical protein